MMAAEPVETENTDEPPEPAPIVAHTAQEELDLSDMRTLGRVLVASKFFKDTESVAKAAVKVLAGRELGLGPVASMNNINIISGRLSLGYPLVAALIKRHPNYDYRVAHLDNQKCVIEFSQKRAGEDWQVVGESQFTIDDAKTAGLLNRSTAWNTYRRNLLFARALTNGARWHCPDVFTGAVYTAEELGESDRDGRT